MKDNRDDCPPGDREFRLYVKVADNATGGDLAAAGAMGEALLYLFDDADRFLRSYEVPAAQIAAREPVVIRDLDMEGVKVSAWGNLDGTTIHTPAQAGTRPEQDAVALRSDPQHEGHDLRLNDLFFGFEELRAGSGTERQTGEVVLSRKNARLHITVRGVGEPYPETCYFAVSHTRRGYDFRGIPTASASRIRNSGAWRGGEYVTPRAWLMIHDTESGPESGEGVRIGFFRELPGGDREVAGAWEDGNGNPIILRSGRTTNVLMEIGADGSLAVRVEVTPWNVVYQWSEH